MTQLNQSGSLFIVATPIGHLDDMSNRAKNTLQSVDIIYAEDTRHSQVLLSHLGIKKPLYSYHSYNEFDKANDIIETLKAGKSVALISDAGTPLISDPGYPLVKLTREAGINVVPIPGPCALITALSAAGIPTDTFTFAGFLPAKKSARIEALNHFSEYAHTLVFYESTHRILDALDDINSVFGEIEIVLAKELTKTFEQFITDVPLNIKQWLLKEPNRCKGEFVLMIPPRKRATEHTQSLNILSLLLEELPLKQAVNIAAKLTQMSKNDLYDQALLMKKSKS